MRDSRTIQNTTPEEIFKIMSEHVPGKKKTRFLNLTFTCKNCENTFHPSREWQTFCNKSCKTEYHNSELANTLLRAEQRRLELEAEVERLITENDELRRINESLR